MSKVSESVQEFIDKQPMYDRRRKIMMPFIQATMKTLCKVDVSGLDHIPASGSTMLISNHMSFFDPGIATAVIDKRYVISMSKIEAINNAVVRLVIAMWGNYYIKRGTVDRQALINTIELIKSGQLVWIAPEGTRHPEGLGEPKDGVAYIASKADAIIVPMSIIGVGAVKQNIRRLRRTPVEVNFGQAFRFKVPEGQRLRSVRSQMTQEAMYRIAHTIPEHHAPLRGIFSDLSEATTETLEFINEPVKV